MSRKDKLIQQLTEDVTKWKSRALYAAQVACENCEEYMSRNRELQCRKCQIFKIREEAGESEAAKE